MNRQDKWKDDKTVTYEWSWACLSLFRKTNDATTGIGGTSRIITLKPAWVWWYWQNWFMVATGKWPPDPFWVYEQWLRKNNLWDCDGKAFFTAIDRYAASCEPGELLRLNPTLLKPKESLL